MLATEGVVGALQYGRLGDFEVLAGKGSDWRAINLIWAVTQLRARSSRA